MTSTISQFANSVQASGSVGSGTAVDAGPARSPGVQASFAPAYSGPLTNARDFVPSAARTNGQMPVMLARSEAQSGEGIDLIGLITTAIALGVEVGKSVGETFRTVWPYLMERMGFGEAASHALVSDPFANLTPAEVRDMSPDKMAGILKTWVAREIGDKSAAPSASSPAPLPRQVMTDGPSLRLGSGDSGSLGGGASSIADDLPPLPRHSGHTGPKPRFDPLGGIAIGDIEGADGSFTGIGPTSGVATGTEAFPLDPEDILGIDGRTDDGGPNRWVYPQSTRDAARLLLGTSVMMMQGGSDGGIGWRDVEIDFNPRLMDQLGGSIGNMVGKDYQDKYDYIIQMIDQRLEEAKTRGTAGIAEAAIYQKMKQTIGEIVITPMVRHVSVVGGEMILPARNKETGDYTAIRIAKTREDVSPEAREEAARTRDTNIKEGIDRVYNRLNEMLGR